MDDAFRYIKANGGIDTEASYPYVGENGRCQFTESNVGATEIGKNTIIEVFTTTSHSTSVTVGTPYNHSHKRLTLVTTNIVTSRLNFHFNFVIKESLKALISNRSRKRLQPLL